MVHDKSRFQYTYLQELKSDRKIRACNEPQDNGNAFFQTIQVLQFSCKLEKVMKQSQIFLKKWTRPRCQKKGQTLIKHFWYNLLSTVYSFRSLFASYQSEKIQKVKSLFDRKTSENPVILSLIVLAPAIFDLSFLQL